MSVIPNEKVFEEREWIAKGVAQCEKYRQWLREIELKLNSYPDGRLVIRQGKESPQWYIELNGKKTYLPHQQLETAKVFAQKGYEIKAVRLLKRWEAKEIVIRKWLEEETLSELYENMSPERKRLVTPLVCSPEEFVEEWLAEEYEGLGFQEGEPEFYAVDGTRVRSKSERDTVDELLEFGVPYKYEKPLQLKGFGLVYPDFHVLNRRTGQEFVWEHFGMMDDRSYAVDNIRKLEAYHYNGYFEGVNFLSTWETRRTPFGRRDARRVIEQYLL